MDVTVVFCVAAWALVLSTILHTIMAANRTEEGPNDGSFFDEKNNIAMFLVLPAIVVVFGSCCVVYCVHELYRRFFLKQRKKNERAKKRREKEMEKHAFSNTVVNIDDETGTMKKGNDAPSNSRRLTTPSAGSKILTLESLENDHVSETNQSKSIKTHAMETKLGTVDDVLKRDSLQAMTSQQNCYRNHHHVTSIKGYQEPFHQNACHVTHPKPLDNQVKVTFRLTQPEESKNVQKNLAANPDQESAKSGTGNVYHVKVQCRSNSQKMDMSQCSSKNKLNAGKIDAAGTTTLHDNVRSVGTIHNSGSTAPPKSRPDIWRRPDENVIALRSVTVKSRHRKVLLSSQ